MDLPTYASVVSTAALLIGCWSLWLHHARWKRDQTDRQPELAWTRGPMAEILPWQKIEITLRNRANARIKAERIRVLWPIKARIVGIEAATITVNEKEPWIPGRLNPPGQPFRAMPLYLEAAQAGAQKTMGHAGFPIMGSGDTHSTELLVSGADSSRLILWISFSSFDRSLRVKSRMIVT